MVANENALPQPEVLEQAIRRSIVQRTGRRIPALQVQVTEGCVVIRGHAASFHLKQLALEGLVEAIGSVGAMQIQFDVQVVACRPGSERID
jgi:hypothetical protein